VSGLRRHERDPGLPARAGEPGLAAPAPEEVGRFFQARLALPEEPAVAAVEWTHARWKPGVSLTCAYEVVLEDGTRVPLAAKRYADGKDRLLAARDATHAIAGRAVVADERLVLFRAAADRELAGLDGRVLARAVERAGLAPPRSVRRRRVRVELLRYKPERRAVARLDLRVRHATPDRMQVLARLHPPARVGAIAERRRALAALGAREILPPFLGADPPSGALFEAWLELDVAAPGTFGHAGDAARLLAVLHRVPLGDARADAGTEEDELAPLFAIDAELARAFARRPVPPSAPAGACAWIHGDFHADQIARGRGARDARGRAWLLDLDRVGPGDPLRDLGAWIADHLDESPDTSFEGAATPLLEAYEEAGGREVDARRLELVVADELVARGAAAIRRLERDALLHARRALDRAREVARRSPRPDGRVRA
jgi:hypothetical protein